MSSGRMSFGRVNLSVGQEFTAECFTYVARSPILDISTGSTSVAVSLAGDEIDETAVRFARTLAEQARVFAAEVERLHAAQAAHQAEPAA
jgi:hypothetical protein